MRIIKKVKSFEFLGLTKEEMLILIDKDLPINIKKLEPIIDRIYEKYPVIDKSEISIIVKTIFEAFRSFLILGYVMTFNKFLFDIKLNFTQIYKYNKYLTALRVKLKPSLILKNGLKND